MSGSWEVHEIAPAEPNFSAFDLHSHLSSMWAMSSVGCNCQCCQQSNACFVLLRRTVDQPRSVIFLMTTLPKTVQAELLME